MTSANFPEIKRGEKKMGKGVYVGNRNIQWNSFTKLGEGVGWRPLKTGKVAEVEYIFSTHGRQEEGGHCYNDDEDDDR